MAGGGLGPTLNVVQLVSHLGRVTILDTILSVLVGITSKHGLVSLTSARSIYEIQLWCVLAEITSKTVLVLVISVRPIYLVQFCRIFSYITSKTVFVLLTSVRPIYSL